MVYCINSLIGRHVWVLALPLIWACNPQEKPTKPLNPTPTAVLTQPDSVPGALLQTKPPEPPLPDTAFMNVLELDSGLVLNMRYATDHNFLDTAVYPCGTCKLRKEVADALVAANTAFRRRGYQLKLFDCYRPLSVQKLMWAVQPDSRYVANPNRNGSVHNRGGAVDLTLQTLDGEPLDMGTDFDHFGPEAHHTYTQLPETVQKNRAMLRQGMEAAGFKALTTEWWHYSYRKNYPLANEPLCE